MHRVRRKLNNEFIPSEFWEHPTQEKILIPSTGCICVLVGLGEIWFVANILQLKLLDINEKRHRLGIKEFL